MCEPTTLAVLGGLGAATSAGGSIMGGMTASANAKRNAFAETQAAEGAITATNTQALNEGIRTGQILGRQRAYAGASGGDANAGSNAVVQQDAGQTGYRSISAILTNGGNVVNQDNAQSAGFSSQASSAITQGFIGAGSSILGGAASVGNQYLMWQRYAQGGAQGDAQASPGMTAYGAGPGMAYY